MPPEIAGDSALTEGQFKNPGVSEDASSSEGALAWIKEPVWSEKDAQSARTMLTPLRETLIRCLLAWLVRLHESLGEPASHSATSSVHDSSATVHGLYSSYSTCLYRLHACVVLLAFLDLDLISSADGILELVRVHLAPLCISQYFTAERMKTQDAKFERLTIADLLLTANNSWVWWELHYRLGPFLPPDLARQTQHQCWEIQWSFQRQILSVVPQGKSDGMEPTARFLRIVSFFVAQTPLLCYLPTPRLRSEGDISSLSSSDTLHYLASDSQFAQSFLQHLVSIAEEAVRVACEGWGWSLALSTSSAPNSLDNTFDAPNGRCFNQIENLKIPNQHLDHESFKLLLSIVHHLVLQWAVFSASPISSEAINDHSEGHHFGAFGNMNSTISRLARTISKFLDFVSPSLAVHVRIANGDDEKIWIQIADLVMWMARCRCRHSNECLSRYFNEHELCSKGVFLPPETLLRLKRILLSASIRYLFLADSCYTRVNGKGDVVAIEMKCRKATEGETYCIPSHIFLTAFIRVWQEWIARLQHSPTLHQGFIKELERDLGLHWNLAAKPIKGSDRRHSNGDDPSLLNEKQLNTHSTSFSSSIKPVRRESGPASGSPSPLSPISSPGCRYFTDNTLLGALLLRSWSRCMRRGCCDHSSISLLLDMTTLMKLQAEKPSFEGLREFKGRLCNFADRETSVLISTSASGKKLCSVSSFPFEPIPATVFLGLFHQSARYLHHLHGKKLTAKKFNDPFSASKSPQTNLFKWYQTLCTPAMITFCAKWSSLVDSLCAVVDLPQEIPSVPMFTAPLTEPCALENDSKRHSCRRIQYVNIYPHNSLPLWDDALVHPFLSWLRASLHAPDTEADMFNQLLGIQFQEVSRSAGVSHEYLEMMADAAFISSIPTPFCEKFRYGGSFIPCIFSVHGVPASAAKERTCTSSSLSCLQVASFFIWQQTRKVLCPEVGDVFEQQPSVQLFFAPQEQQRQPNAITETLKTCQVTEWGRTPCASSCFNYSRVEYGLHYLVFILSEAFSRATKAYPMLSSRDASAAAAAFDFVNAPKQNSAGNRRRNRLRAPSSLQRPDNEGSASMRSPKLLLARACPSLRTSIREDVITATACIDQDNEVVSSNVCLFVSSYSDWCLKALWRCLCAVGRRFQYAVEEDWMNIMNLLYKCGDNVIESTSQYEKYSARYNNISSYHAYIREKLLDESSGSSAFTEKDGNDDDGALERWHAVRSQVCALEPWIQFMKREGFFTFTSTTSPSSNRDGTCDLRMQGDARDRYKTKTQGTACMHVLTSSQARLLLRGLFQFPEATFLTFPLDLLRALWDSAASPAQESNLAHSEHKSLTSPDDLDELTVWLLWIGLAQCSHNLEEEVCEYVVAAFSDVLPSRKDRGSCFGTPTESLRLGLDRMQWASPMELLRMATTVNINNRALDLLCHKGEVNCIINTERSSAVLNHFSLDAVHTYYFVMERPFRGMHGVIRTLLLNSESLNSNNNHARENGSLFSRHRWYLDRLNVIISLARQAAEVVMS
ncbi:unnamed protein product [Phytomonas sp. EM1]|nr:unnamed protein product [Phytomonas sp. EM1]|eukprot:CCW64136.1 unnamed protein product [Phytomonas sp. isolate EM1]